MAKVPTVKYPEKKINLYNLLFSTVKGAFVLEGSGYLSFLNNGLIGVTKTRTFRLNHEMALSIEIVC